MDDTYRSQFRIPQYLYEKLKASSVQTRRSLNTELVARLESTFHPPDLRSADLSSVDLGALIDELMRRYPPGRVQVSIGKLDPEGG